MWGLKMRTLGFIKECTLCFLENMGRKVEKRKILEIFKGGGGYNFLSFLKAYQDSEKPKTRSK